MHCVANRWATSTKNHCLNYLLWFLSNERKHYFEEIRQCFLELRTIHCDRSIHSSVIEFYSSRPPIENMHLAWWSSIHERNAFDRTSNSPSRQKRKIKIQMKSSECNWQRSKANPKTKKKFFVRIFLSLLISDIDNKNDEFAIHHSGFLHFSFRFLSPSFLEFHFYFISLLHRFAQWQLTLYPIPCRICCDLSI